MRYCIYCTCNKIFSKEFVIKFIAFCALILYTLYFLCVTYGQKAFTLANCLIYLFGQPSHYYLFITPIMVIILSGSADFDAYSIYEVVRISSIRAYAWTRIGKMIAISVLSMGIFTLAATMLYLPFCSFTQSWTVFNDLRMKMGYSMVQDSLYSFSGWSIVLIQLAMTTLSFAATGLFLLLLKACVRNKNLPTVFVLFGKLVMYLACHASMASMEGRALHCRVLPYFHTLISFTDSQAALASNALYWLALIAALIVGCLYAMEKKDYIANTAE